VARVAEWASRNGLALCCVVAPLLFALIAFNGVLWWLTPDIATNIHIDYRPANAAQSLAKPATTTTTTTTTTTAGDAATTTTTTTDAPTTKPESAKGNDTAERTNPNQRFLCALYNIAAKRGTRRQALSFTSRRRPSCCSHW
jgi:hypothetical protein